MAIDDALIQQVTRTVVAHFHPRCIIPFGSQARGVAWPDTDMDLIIEMDTQSRRKTAADISMLFGFRDRAIDIIIYTPEKVARHTGQVGSMLYIAETEGRVLYEHLEHAPAVSRVA